MAGAERSASVITEKFVMQLKGTVELIHNLGLYTEKVVHVHDVHYSTEPYGQ